MRSTACKSKTRGPCAEIGAAVDASGRTMQMAVEQGDRIPRRAPRFFWPGLPPPPASLHRALKLALDYDLALYSAHLPLDFHPRIGNNALLAATLGLHKHAPFLEREGLIARPSRPKPPAAGLFADPAGRIVRRSRSLIGAGPMETKRIGIVTGGAGGEIYAAARAESTPTSRARRRTGRRSRPRSSASIFSRRSLRDRDLRREGARRRTVGQRFEVPWEFLDHPTGL